MSNADIVSGRDSALLTVDRQQEVNIGPIVPRRFEYIKNDFERRDDGTQEAKFLRRCPVPVDQEQPKSAL